MFKSEPTDQKLLNSFNALNNEAATIINTSKSVTNVFTKTVNDLKSQNENMGEMYKAADDYVAKFNMLKDSLDQQMLTNNNIIKKITEFFS